MNTAPKLVHVRSRSGTQWSGIVKAASTNSGCSVEYYPVYLERGEEDAMRDELLMS